MSPTLWLIIGHLKKQVPLPTNQNMWQPAQWLMLLPVVAPLVSFLEAPLLYNSIESKKSLTWKTVWVVGWVKHRASSMGLKPGAICKNVLTHLNVPLSFMDKIL